ncbi:hypothetical protein E2C01_098229 [Portunus trituberculatus]|uniref:Uncharacterized protein n=1 Tax=Portunus trituberculatus TaxID=210409 RepID=A0A5B7K2H1_PORTR|nr:hypothetical protein [Portunus trituberculatus]
MGPSGRAILSQISLTCIDAFENHITPGEEAVVTYHNDNYSRFDSTGSRDAVNLSLKTAVISWNISLLCHNTSVHVVLCFTLNYMHLAAPTFFTQNLKLNMATPTPALESPSK